MCTQSTGSTPGVKAASYTMLTATKVSDRARTNLDEVNVSVYYGVL